MKQRHRLRPLAAALLASLLLAMPASASWGYSEETSTQTGDYVNSDDAEANAQKAEREQQKAAYQQQINDRQNDLDKLKAEQKELQNKLAGVSGQKQQAQAVKASLDADLDNVLGQISTLNLQIEAMNESIKMTEEDIAASKQSINEQISLLRKRILTSYKAGYSDALSVVLGADSYYESLVRTRVITEIADRDKDIITELSAEKEELEEKDLIPFRAGIQTGLGAILVSHNRIAALDADTPASLSSAVIGYLRDTLGYDRVVITDDLSMGALEDYTPEEAAVLAVKAGADLLCSTDFESQLSAVLEAARSGEISQDRVDEAVYRVLSWKAQLGLIG